MGWVIVGGQKTRGPSQSASNFETRDSRTPPCAEFRPIMSREGSMTKPTGVRMDARTCCPRARLYRMAYTIPRFVRREAAMLDA